MLFFFQTIVDVIDKQLLNTKIWTNYKHVIRRWVLVNTQDRTIKTDYIEVMLLVNRVLNSIIPDLKKCQKQKNKQLENLGNI